MTQTSSSMTTVKVSWILNPGRFPNLLAFMPFWVEMVWNRKANFFAPGWKPDHFGEGAESLREKLAGEFGKVGWELVGRSGQKQRPCLRQKRGQ